jgi:hypothetical protein
MPHKGSMNQFYAIYIKNGFKTPKKAREELTRKNQNEGSAI